MDLQKRGQSSRLLMTEVVVDSLVINSIKPEKNMLSSYVNLDDVARPRRDWYRWGLLVD
jgi:hypothetical protein